jgi:hypothetical protein
MIDDPRSGPAAATRYLALEPGATLLRAPADESDPSAVSIGRSVLAPAEPGSEVVTRDWSVRIVDAMRGADALRLVETANPRNADPAEGLEFVAIKLHARFHGEPGRSGLLSPSQFRVVDKDGKAYDVPIVLDVTPRLTRTLFPGGEHTGWAVFQVAPGDPNPLLRFEPFFPDREVRYLGVRNSVGREASNARTQPQAHRSGLSDENPAWPGRLSALVSEQQGSPKR